MATCRTFSLNICRGHQYDLVCKRIARPPSRCTGHRSLLFFRSPSIVRHSCQLGHQLLRSAHFNSQTCRTEPSKSLRFIQSCRSRLFNGVSVRQPLVFNGSRKSTIAMCSIFSVPVIYLVYQCWKKKGFQNLLSSVRGEVLIPESSKDELQRMLIKSNKKRTLFTWWKYVKEFMLFCLRIIHLNCIFFPLFLVYPITYIHSRCFSLWLTMMYKAVERSGATFVKLGQWASTRRDLFSAEFCDLFSGLHHRVQPHGWSHTQKVLEKAYGKDWQHLLHLTEGQEPIGSGCIAQVYKGYISTDFIPTAVMKELEEEANKAYFGEGVEISSYNNSDDDDDDGYTESKHIDGSMYSSEDVIPVAIKVLHPNIREAFRRDLKLMKITARYLTLLFPNLHWVNLNQCVQEFAVSMKKQLDLRHESRCLQRFTKDFSSSPCIRVPQPIPKFVRSNILVESFEEGLSIGQLLQDENQPAYIKKELAQIGMDILLQMVFENNFVHADLHPGNLLVQNLDHCNKKKTSVLQVDALGMMMVSVQPVEELPLRLVLLDCGITASLKPADRHKFTGVFTAVVEGDGKKVADLFLTASAVNHCSDAALFRKEMAEIVDKGRQNLLNISKIKVAELMREVFSVLSRHKIQLDSSFATIILAMAMLEGLGRSLDPEINILSKARPVLLKSLF